MSSSFIYVKPSTDASKVKVLTELLGELEIPVYISANSDGTIVDSDNPAQVEAAPIVLAEATFMQQESILDAIENLGTQLKIMNIHLQSMTGEKITKEDI